jgi:hypothetical protein
MKYMSGFGLLFVVLVPLSTLGDGMGENSLVKFRGGIGVDPISNVVVSTAMPPVTTATANTVRGISPAGQIWVIAGLDADVSTDGHILVRGRGLLLGGGNGIGTTAGQSVFATLFCGPAASATASSSKETGVLLEANGDFSINDVLTPAPSSPCDTPVLLIRSAAGTNNWFAAGIPD